MPISVMLADDHTIVTSGLRNILKAHEDIEVMAAFKNGAEVLDSLKSVRPDVLLLDIQLPDFSGIELLGLITKNHPGVRVLMLTSLDNVFYVREAMQHGASGYLTKDTSEDMLVKAIRQVHAGETFLEDHMKQELMDSMFRVNKTKARQPPLSRREKEILKLIIEEKTNTEIASQLYISPRTVEAHRQSLLLKLGVKNIVGLVKRAMQLGLVTQ